MAKPSPLSSLITPPLLVIKVVEPAVGEISIIFFSQESAELIENSIGRK